MESSARDPQPRKLKRRRVIERPRLFALLDDSSARVRSLVAPAGYGKTTLADQWSRKNGRRAAWYTARRSSTDVAALALGLARTCSELFPGCDERLVEHLRAVPQACDQHHVLATMLGEDLGSWGAADWLVLDDYQELTSSAAESFVFELISACPLQLLIATRQRPMWVSERHILYGEVLELNQTALAMNTPEAAQVLGNSDGPVASGLVALADGWPAVIGLASVSSADLDVGSQIPDSLYQFFAEEVFEALGDTVRSALAVLAVAPLLDRELAARLLGERAEAPLSAALDVGILVERGGRLELHPLARSFIEERGGQTGLIASEDSRQTCLDYYVGDKDWDAAFELVARHGMHLAFERLLRSALDDLIDSARLSTIEAWCAHAAEVGVDTPIVALARAELLLRQSRLAEAQTFAEAASREASLEFRGLLLAGRAANLASREDDALALYRRAEVAATCEEDRREARWGQIGCAVELEQSDVGEALDKLSAEVEHGDPRESVRAASQRLHFQLRVVARLDLEEAENAWQLIDTVGDPLVRTAFESVYANALTLSARYDEALDVARKMLATAERYRLDFASLYALYSVGYAHIGRREWSAASDYLGRAMLEARRARNRYAEQSCYAVSLRALVQQGLHAAALELPIPSLRSSLPAVRAEVLASRALVLASAGRLPSARAMLDDVYGTSTGVEQAVLVPAVEAVIAMKSGDDAVLERMKSLEEAAFSTGALDLLVTAYRCVPEVLAVLLRSSDPSSRVADLIRRAGDADLARSIGRPVEVTADPLSRLSKREREVHDLLLQGLPHRKVAEALFISESTAKLHAHRVYEKLGVHSRTALIVQASLRGARQATSAIDASSEPASS